MSHIVETLYDLLLEAYGLQGWWPLFDGKKGESVYLQRYELSEEARFEISLGALLTQNTNWKNVEKALASLSKAGLLSRKRLEEVDLPDLAAFITPAGYFNQKSRYIKNLLAWLNDTGPEYQTIMAKPLVELRESLLSVTGIGPETADSILLYAMEKPLFVVDAYTKRIFSRLGLLEEKAPYGRVQEYFHSSLTSSRDLYGEYHALIVNHAKEHCAKTPKCDNCPLMEFCIYCRP
jgi:endonuclease III related protein